MNTTSRSIIHTALAPEKDVENVVFVDGVDPDNLTMVALAVLHRRCRHVVLIGRPTNLNVPSKPFDPKTCRRGRDETDVPEHAERVLHSFAHRLRLFLDQLGCSEEQMPSMYDGGVAPITPMAHSTHVADFLLIKADGSVPNFKEYTEMIAQLDAASETDGGRGEAAMALMKDHVGKLIPLKQLVPNLNAEAANMGRGPPTVRFLVGGPLGPVQTVMTSSPELNVEAIYAQAATWEFANLFPNQFNVACDPQAAIKLTENPKCPVKFVTTDFCKEGLAFKLGDIEHDNTIPEVLRDMYALWYYLTGKPSQMTVFDVGPLFISDRDPTLVPLVPVKCTLGEDGLFRLEQVMATPETVGPGLVQATPATVDPAVSRKAKEQLLQALASLAEFKNTGGSESAGCVRP
jgi:hypothetical protein